MSYMNDKNIDEKFIHSQEMKLEIADTSIQNSKLREPQKVCLGPRIFSLDLIPFCTFFRVQPILRRQLGLLLSTVSSYGH